VKDAFVPFLTLPTPIVHVDGKKGKQIGFRWICFFPNNPLFAFISYTYGRMFSFNAL
jgi:hypothetical protein